MKKAFLFLFSLLCVLSAQAEEQIGLTLIPPGKVTNKINLDIRGGIVNKTSAQQTYQVSLYWGKENKSALLCDTTLNITAGKSDMVKVVLPMKDKVGKHKVILKVVEGSKVYRRTQEVEVINSDIRSIQQISGAGAGIYHWSEEGGKHWKQDIKKMTDDQWREMMRSMHKSEMDRVVIQEVFRHQAYMGSTTTVDNYPGKAFYPSKL